MKSTLPLLVIAIVTVLTLSSFGRTFRSSCYDGSLGIGAQFSFRPDFNSSVSMTVEAWVYREASNRCEAILSQGPAGSYWFGFCPGLEFARSEGSSASATVEVPARRWTHVAASYDGTTVRFFVDGQPAGMSAVPHSGTTTSGDVWIGRHHSVIELVGFPSTTLSFHGYIDELRLWSTPRTAAEIADNRFREVRGVPGLVAVWDTGGWHEAVSGSTGSSPGAPPTSSSFGILPSDLVVADVAGNPNNPLAITRDVELDGEVDPGHEYRRAELIALRYTNRATEADAVGYLLHRGPPGGKLYLGVQGARLPMEGLPANHLSISLDTDLSRDSSPDAGDYRITVPFNGDPPIVQRGGASFPLAGWSAPDPALASLVAVAIGSPPGEGLQSDLEIALDSALLGGEDFWMRTQGIAISHEFPLSAAESAIFPTFADPLAPDSWALLSHESAFDSSLFLANPENWAGFDFATKLEVVFEPADGTPSRTSLTLRDSQNGTVAPSADLEAGERFTLPRTEVKLPDSGSAAVSLDVWYQVGSATVPDSYGWDLRAGVKTPMVDFGTGLEPANAEVFLTEPLLIMTSQAPMWLPDARWELPGLAPVPPGLFRVVEVFDLPVGGGIFRAMESEGGSPGLFLPFQLNLPTDFLRMTVLADVDPVPFGSRLAFEYSAFGIAGVEAGLEDGMVEHALDSGVGSLRDFIERTPVDRIRFHPSLDGSTILLGGTPLSVFKRALVLDASGLPNGVTISADGRSRTFLIDESSSLTLNNITVTDGKSASGPGGGIYSEGALTLNNCVVRRCSVDAEQTLGGGIFNAGGMLNIVGSTIELNSASDGGGVSSIDGDVFIMDSLFEDNSAIERGGGLSFHGQGNLLLTNSTWLNNTSNRGAALYQDGGSAQLSQVTISSSHKGFASWHNAGLVVIAQSTISGNQSGGVAAANKVEVVVGASIAAGNQGDDLHVEDDASFKSHGSNLVGTGVPIASFDAPGDQTGILDPGLSSPGSHGGPVPTMIPASGSPARDAVKPGTVTPPTDARGLPRLVGPAPDIGAYETGNRHGGYFAWAVESIPEHLDRSFAGHADYDHTANGLEYVLGTSALRSDPLHPNNPAITFDGDVELIFGYAPNLHDVGWRVLRRSAGNQTVTALIGVQDGLEFMLPTVSKSIDFISRRIHIVDGDPPAGAAIYSLEVFLLE